MSQNISLWGANYSNVPSVELPKQGGGTASFTDVSDTTAAASDVASGKYFYTSAGVKTAGTASGGASNFVMGEFTTSSSSGVHSVTIPYTGTGYPIAIMVYVEGGAYNNSDANATTWYNSVQRYAVGQWTYSKRFQYTEPDYGASGTKNQGVTTAIYKNSTSSATSYTRTSAMSTVVLTSNDPSAAAVNVVTMSSKTTMKYYTAASSYGLLGNLKYTYIIVYSS